VVEPLKYRRRQYELFQTGWRDSSHGGGIGEHLHRCLTYVQL